MYVSTCVWREWKWIQSGLAYAVGAVPVETGCEAVCEWHLGSNGQRSPHQGARLCPSLTPCVPRVISPPCSQNACLDLRKYGSLPDSKSPWKTVGKALFSLGLWCSPTCIGSVVGFPKLSPSTPSGPAHTWSLSRFCSRLCAFSAPPSSLLPLVSLTSYLLPPTNGNWLLNFNNKTMHVI